MRPAPDLHLRSMAEVIARIGLNLQPGQSILVTDPYELQGAPPEATPLIDAVRSVTSADTKVIAGDPTRLRALVEQDDLAGYEALIVANTRQMLQHLAGGGTFLFLPGGTPRLLAGLPPERVSRFADVKWRHLGPLIQRLIRGATQWTLAPVPTAEWAALVFADLPPAKQLPALWDTVFRAMRVHDGSNGSGDPSSESVLAAWQSHLTALARRRDELNAARHRRIRYVGPGTELTLELPRSRLWCTAQLKTRRGLPFVANLPTEEIFTAPHKGSATGRVRITRPVVHGGTVIEGIELEFRNGRVRTATSATNSDLLNRLLATDDGADRIGEVALVPANGTLGWADRFHHHALLDENATPHIAIGDAYRFCSRAWLPLALNSSQVHLDLPLEAKVELLA